MALIAVTGLTLHSVRASSAQELQPRRRQISKTAREILGALDDTYIMSAIREKLSTLALDTYACMRVLYESPYTVTSQTEHMGKQWASTP